MNGDRVAIAVLCGHGQGRADLLLCQPNAAPPCRSVRDDADVPIPLRVCQVQIYRRRCFPADAIERDPWAIAVATGAGGTGAG